MRVDPAFLVRLLITPLTVALACFVQRRLGPAAGGRLVGLPLTTGPFLVVLSMRAGDHAAGVAAGGVVAGQLSVVGFCAVYAGLAARLRPLWTTSSALAGSLGCGAVGLLAHREAVPSAVTFLVVLAAILVAVRAVPDTSPTTPARPPRPVDLPLRIVVTTALVATLVESSAFIGAGLAGLLATAPVILTIMAPATHRADGPQHAAALARGALVTLPASVVAAEIAAQTLGRSPTVVAAALALGGLALVEVRRNLGAKAQDGRAVRQRDLELADVGR